MRRTAINLARKRSYRCRTAVIIFITVYNAADRYLRLPTVRQGLDFMFFS